MAASTSCLTIPQGQGQTVNRHHHIVMAGFDSLNHEAHKSRATEAAFFVPVRKSKDNGRTVWGAARLAGPHASLSTCTVLPSLLTGGERSYRPLHEDSNMANANTTGKIRPTSTVTEIRWIKEPTAVKRLRRHLATIGQQLVITKAGTWQRQHWGRMAIVEDTGEVYLKSVDLESRLRAFGLMADDEQIEIEGRAWRFFVARHRVEIIDGRSVGYNDQVSREYTTRAAAEKAADRIGGEDLAIVGFDAGLVKGGTKNADR